MSFITLSGRRWKTHGSSKEGSGKEAGSKKASQKGGTEEEIIFIYTKTFFNLFTARLVEGSIAGSPVDILQVSFWVLAVVISPCHTGRI